MAQIFTLFLFLLAVFSPLQQSHAQTLPEECDIENLDACVIQYPLFCQNETSGTFEIGVSERGTITFTSQFTGKSPWKKFVLFFQKETLTAGGASERKITPMTCTGDEETGKTCFGEISVAEAIAVSNTFDTEAKVIRTALRVGNSGKAKRDRCIGTFTNNTEAVVQNNRLVRRYCSFTPSTDSSLSGEGFFDPRSYGARPSGDLDPATESTYNPHFSLKLSGFPANAKLRGCLEKENGKGYQEVFTFNAWEVTRTDEEIYNRFDEETARKLAFEPEDYSYDLSRSLLSQSNRLDVSKNLSNVNLEISRPSASNATKQSNRERKSKRKRKRDKKKNNKRSINTRSLVTVAATDESRGKESAVNWLSFSPDENRSVYLARKCNAQTPQKAFGTVTCGNDLGDGRICKFLTPTDSSSSVTGIFCTEHRDGGLYQLVTTRVLGLSAGDYTVCIDNVEVPVTFSPIGDEASTYASLELTDSDTVADAAPSIYKSTVDITNFDALSVGTGGCDNPILTGALSNEN